MMRKIFLVFLALLVLACGICASAESNTSYRLDELGLTVEIPSEIPVFTRDITPDDPYLEQFGLSKTQVDSMMGSGNIYLNGIANDVSYEIVITMIESPLNDFFYLSDTELSTLASMFLDEYKDGGIELIEYGVYSHPQAKFLKIYISQPNNGETIYGLQYYTVYDGKAINFTLHSYSGSISDSQEKLINGIVDGVVFDKTPEKEPFIETASFTYTDSRTGLSFVVPKNWEEESLSKPRETIDVQFSSVENAGISILYGSVDIWGQMTTDEKAGLTRADINNASFSIKDIADMFEMSTSDVQQVTFGDKEYFKISRKEETSYAGMSVTVPMTIIFRFEDGYWYNFQFGGEAASRQYGDFESLISSAQYRTNVTTSVGPGTTPSDTNNFVADDSTSFVVSFILSFIVTICIYSLPIFIYRYAIVKAPIAPKKAKKVCIIYAVCAFIVMAVLLAILRGINAAPGGAIFLWSWINYTVLTRGYTQPICVSDSVQVANVNSDIETEPEGIGTFDSAEILMSGLEGESVPESSEGTPSDLGDTGGSGIESK